jgi:hypothetical protein
MGLLGATLDRLQLITINELAPYGRALLGYAAHTFRTVPWPRLIGADPESKNWSFTAATDSFWIP